jgi:hypothetical protein
MTIFKICTLYAVTRLSNYVSSGKIVGSISDEVIDLILPIGLWPWGMTQFLKERNARNIPRDKARPESKDDSLTHCHL